MPAITGGETLTFGDIDLPHSCTYIRDVARGLATLGETPDGDGRIWHLPTVPARTTRDMLALIGSAVGHPVETHTLERPEPFGSFDQTFMDGYAEMFYQHVIAQNLVSDAFAQRFGVVPTSLEEGITATVEWDRMAGLATEAAA